MTAPLHEESCFPCWLTAIGADLRLANAMTAAAFAVGAGAGASVGKIRFHPANVGRDLGDLRDLTESVKEHGVLVPVILERHQGGLRLRDGHRRVTAARLAKVPQVLAFIHGDALDEAAWLLESIDYNQRQKGLDNAERERIARRLVELNVTRTRIAQAFGISRAKVDQLLDDEPKAQPAPAPKRPRAVVSVKALRELRDYVDQQGYDPLFKSMLVALIEGRDWREAS